MRPRSWARDVTHAQAQRGDVSRTCLRAKPAGHGRDKCAQPVVIAWSKLLREWPAVATWWARAQWLWSSEVGDTVIDADTDVDFDDDVDDLVWPLAMTKMMMMMVMLVSG